MPMPKRQSPAKMQAECDRFNSEHIVGSFIRVAPGARDGERKVVQIVKPGAYVMGGHTAVVQVTGGHGCIALSHVLGRA